MSREIRRALANETRLHILKGLKNKPQTYTNLMVSIGMDVDRDRGKFTYHVNLLKDVKLIDQEGDFYRITKQGEGALVTTEKVETIRVRKHTAAWYVVPLLLGIIGGIIGYIVIKDDDPKMAKNLLILGTLMTFLIPGGIGFLIKFVSALLHS